MHRGYFWPFRLLIAAIFALAMLTIIISAIEYFKNVQRAHSYERFESGFRNALNAASSDPAYGLVLEKDLTLVGTITVGQFAEKYDISRDCIEMQAFGGTKIRVSEDQRKVEIEKEITIDVYFQCIRYNVGECEIRCYIAFGRKPDLD
ncbi:MAG: hypothetical protein QXM75_02910 [Candidatus Diapherotrites archaeon]